MLQLKPRVFTLMFALGCVICGAFASTGCTKDEPTDTPSAKESANKGQEEAFRARQGGSRAPAPAPAR